VPTSIRIRRVYDPPEPGDGKRVLVDRLWPRGVAKDGSTVDGWVREVAPSDELRKWFGHDPKRWEEFARRYRAELADHADDLDRLVDLAAEGPLTLLYAARDTEHNNAVVLRDVVTERLARRRE
jgi:uncharacterized protein YeaO (DUF488 family)